MNGNGSSSKMAATHPNSCVSLSNHHSNNNIQQQQHQQFYQQQQHLLNLNEGKGSRLVRGKTLLLSIGFITKWVFKISNIQGGGCLNYSRKLLRFFFRSILL